MAPSTHHFSGLRLESILYVEKFIVKVLNRGIVTTRRGVKRSEKPVRHVNRRAIQTHWLTAALYAAHRMIPMVCHPIKCFPSIEKSAAHRTPQLHPDGRRPGRSEVLYMWYATLQVCHFRGGSSPLSTIHFP